MNTTTTRVDKKALSQFAETVNRGTVARTISTLMRLYVEKPEIRNEVHQRMFSDVFLKK